MLTGLMLSLLAAAPAEDDGWARGTERALPPPPTKLSSWSTELLEPGGSSRFHAITRAAFGGGSGDTKDATNFSFEARAHVQLTKGVALTGVFPVGLSTGRPEGTQALVGNPSLGLTVGGTPFFNESLTLRLAGGLDGYIPLAADGDEVTPTAVTLASLRSYDVGLFVPKALSIRGRFGAELSVSVLTFGAELGVIPVVSFAEDRDGVAVLLGAAGRVSVEATSFFEPYVELGGTTQLGGDGDIAPPFVVTPGLRFHIADAFDPAIFVSLNFVEPGAVMIGLDLATAIRPTPAKVERERRIERMF